jgi:hypothetical protein
VIFYLGWLFDDDLSSWNSFAGEFAFFDFDKTDDTIDCGVDSEVTAHVRTGARNLGATGLADENFTCADFLATKTLDAEALTSIIMDVFAGSTSFDM